ncbi:MAG: LysM peptidoglycan-binding domain-containing protein [Clostridia bacterium]|nr:LysM peptidoglycan-binding domain-containing protein [Clostridia bacterium]
MKKKSYKKSLKIDFNIVFRNMLTVFIIIAVFNVVSNFTFGEREFKTNTITVEENSTLWNIAKQICNNNDNLNIQNVMIDIKEANNLKNSDIYVGQTLLIPEY